MIFFDQVMRDLKSDFEIPILISACSAGDISVLAAMLDSNDALGTTTKGSANFNLWNCFEDHGWMSKSEQAKDLGSELPVEILSYELTDKGRRAIPVILAHANS